MSTDHSRLTAALAIALNRHSVLDMPAQEASALNGLLRCEQPGNVWQCKVHSRPDINLVNNAANQSGSLAPWTWARVNQLKIAIPAQDQTGPTKSYGGESTAMNLGLTKEERQPTER